MTTTVDVCCCVFNGLPQVWMESLYLRSLLYASCSYLQYIAKIKACTISDVFQLSQFADILGSTSSVDNFVAGKCSSVSPPNIDMRLGLPLPWHPYTPSSHSHSRNTSIYFGYPDI